MPRHSVLDLDLDFFLNHRVDHRSDNGPRLRDDEFHPWPADSVRSLLESQCCLSTDKPIPGRFVEHHDGAFV
jgi:hypothetical protein